MFTSQGRGTRSMSCLHAIEEACTCSQCTANCTTSSHASYALTVQCALHLLDTSIPDHMCQANRLWDRFAPAGEDAGASEAWCRPDPEVELSNGSGSTLQDCGWTSGPTSPAHNVSLLCPLAESYVASVVQRHAALWNVNPSPGAHVLRRTDSD
jgi:hypothetical protein